MSEWRHLSTYRDSNRGPWVAAFTNGHSTIRLPLSWWPPDPSQIDRLAAMFNRQGYSPPPPVVPRNA